MSIFYLNGQFVEESEAKLSVLDLAVLRGYGVFDFFRSYHRKPFRLADHIQRFRRSAGQIGLPIRETDDELARIIQATIDKNPQFNEVNVRFLYTGGVSPDGVTPVGNGSLMVLVSDKHQLPPSWYTDGVKVITVNDERTVPSAKSINYLGAVMAQQQAARCRAVEALYVNAHGNVTEGTTTNLFGVKNRQLITPNEHMLPGITRQVLLELLPPRFPIELRSIAKEELFQFDELFMTASNKEIVPIVRVDQQTIGTGKPGPVTQEVMAAFKAYTDAFAES